MPESIYILDETPVYDEAIRALQDSDPARASTIFNPLIGKLLNNTHHVKQQVEAVAESVGGDGGAANIKLTDGTSVEVAIGDLKEHKAALDPLTGKILVEQLPAMDYDIQGSAALVQGNLDSHTGNTTIHVTQADKDTWSAKETPTGAQAKADAVQANLNGHTGAKSNPHGVTAAQAGAATVDLANVTNANFKAKAENAGAAGQKIFDQVIRTQAEFEALIASPTWLDAVSVCFIGNGGTLKFTRSDGQGCKIPQTVKQIQGMNSATIEVTNFAYNATTNKAALWYGTAPTTDDYWIDGMAVNCTSTGTDGGTGFHSCTQLTNCTGTSNGNGYGFHSCTQLTNCTGNGTSNGNGYGFYSCTQLTNCTGTGNGRGYENDGYGFYSCTQLTNCTGTGNGTGSINVSGFKYCTKLTNCTGTGTSNGGHGYGFYFCTQLTNCSGTGNGYGACGFSDCTQLTNCSGTGTGDSYGYGFYDCSYLNGCKQGATSSTDGFLGGTNTKVDTATVVAT